MPSCSAWLGYPVKSAEKMAPLPEAARDGGRRSEFSTRKHALGLDRILITFDKA